MAGIAALAVLILLVAACGGTTELPAAPPCTAPTATPTGRLPTESRYRRTVMDGIDGLARLLSDFRGQWPDGKFSSKPEFREDFATYAGQAECLAETMKTLVAPPPLSAFRSILGALMAEYETTLEAGKDAVRQRNVSKYRDWNRDIDTVAGKVHELSLQLGR